MTNKIANRVKMTVSGAPGTGPITLGSAVSGFQSFTAAGVSNNDTVPYVLEDGTSWEIGVGTYTASGTSLARTSITASSNSGSAISATANAIVMISPLAADLQAGTAAGNLVQLDGSAKLPAVDGSALTALNGSNIATGTIASARIDTGTSANKIIALDASAKYPAADGSLITNLSGGNISSGTINSARLPSISLTSGVTGTLPVANGGTGLTSLTAGYIPYGNGTGAFSNSANFVFNSSGNLNIGNVVAGYSLAANLGQTVIQQNGGGINLCLVNSTNDAYTYLFNDGTQFKISNSYGSSAGLKKIVLSTGGDLTLDPNGNLGLGVTPSAWNTVTALQIGRASVYNYSDYETGWSSNAYYASGWKYIATGSAASQIRLNSGVVQFLQAPSGTAGSAISFTQAMTLDASGNLGIGITSSILGKIHTSAADNNWNFYCTAVSGGVRISGYNNGFASPVIEGVTATASAYSSLVVNGTPLILATNGSERARIDASGNLLVGTTTARNRLTVAGGSNVNPPSLGATAGSVFICGSDASYGLLTGQASSGNHWMQVQRVDGTATAYNLLLQPTGGEVVCGGATDNGAYNLQCNGTAVWGAGAYVNGSDERIKDNIQDISACLDVVKSLRPVTFQYKSDFSKDTNIQPGFIAQDLQQALAGQAYEAGVVMEGPQYLSVAYQALIPVLTKSIQELAAKVSALEAKQ